MLNQVGFVDGAFTGGPGIALRRVPGGDGFSKETSSTVINEVVELLSKAIHIFSYWMSRNVSKIS